MALTEMRKKERPAPPVGCWLQCLGQGGGVSRGRGGGWQEFQEKEVVETKMEGDSQALWEHGRISCPQGDTVLRGN